MVKLLGDLIDLDGERGARNFWLGMHGQGPLRLRIRHTWGVWSDHSQAIDFPEYGLLVPDDWNKTFSPNDKLLLLRSIRDAQGRNEPILYVNYQDLVELFLAKDTKRWLKEWNRRGKAGIYGLSPKIWEEDLIREWHEEWPGVPLPVEV